jgi:hypothetical protein
MFPFNLLPGITSVTANSVYVSLGVIVCIATRFLLSRSSKNRRPSVSTPPRSVSPSPEKKTDGLPNTSRAPAEIAEYGDFPDYASLSGVPLPSEYKGFDITKALPRPYRPFRWVYHQTMCKPLLPFPFCRNIRSINCESGVGQPLREWNPTGG